MQTARIAFKLMLVAVFAFLSNGCQHATVVPMPVNEPEYLQPVNRPLHFTPETKIKWTDSLPIKPTIKKFAFNNLPVKYYDSTGFLPFQKKPEVSHFDLDKLRDTVFNYDALPSAPLKLETSILEQPRIIRSVHPRIRSGLADIIYEFGDPFLDNHVNAVFKDNKGLMWISSTSGLYCYDGENLLEYLRGSAKFTITAILEDEDGKIWLGTSNNFLYVLDVKSGIKSRIEISFAHKDYSIDNMFLDHQHRIWFATYNHTAEAGNPVFIIDQTAKVMKQISRVQGAPNGSGMIQDSSGKIWMAGFGEGIYIVDLNKRRIKYLNAMNGLIGDTLVDIRYTGRNGFIVADFHGGFSKVDIQQKSITNYDQDQGLSMSKNVFVDRILEDQQGNIWIADYASREPGFGIEIIDLINDKIKHINKANGLNGDHVYDMAEDNRGQIWIGSEAGLNILHEINNSPKHLGRSNTMTLAEDTHGNIWVGIIDSGIEILDTATGIVKIFNAKNGLGNNSINNMDNFNGNIFIEGAGGLDIVDSGFKNIRHIGKAQGLPKDSIRDAFVDNEGKIWIYGYGEVGLSVVDLKKQEIFHLGIAQGLKDSVIDFVRQDPDGNIWISNYNKGISVLNLKTNTLKRLDGLPQIQNVGTKIMVPDKQGNMWISPGNGIYRINAKADSVLMFSKKEGFTVDFISSLNVYGNDIYVGSRVGSLTIITPPAFSENNKWNIVSIGKLEGISKTVNSVRSDIITRDGKFLWGDKGLTILRKSFLQRDIVQNYISGIDLLNKPLFFSNKSIPEIYGDTIRSAMGDTFFLRKNISDFSTYSSLGKIKWDSISGRYNMPVNLQFPYDENYLQFHFVQESNNRKDTVWYRYILEGIDKKWSDKTFNTSSENYLNLPPGSYTFKVTSLSNGKWSEPADFKFRILPPWWETWWAYSLFVLALFGLIWIFINYRSKQLIRQNRLLEEKVNLRTRELIKEKEKVENTLSELKTAQAQLVQSEKMASLGELTAGIAHEIQNPLNFVNNFSDVNKELLLEMKEEMNKGNLKEAVDIANSVIENEQKINNHGRRADGIVKSMLQHSQLNVGKKELTDINNLADEYLNLAYHGLRAKDKSFNVIINTNYDRTIGNVLIIPQDIGRVFLNLCNNAFYAVNEKAKLGVEGFKPAIWVTTKNKDSSVEISVKDNGGGIPPKVLDKVFQPFFTTKPTGQGTGLGLSLSYDIIKAHGGELKIITKEAGGAEFLIKIPVI